MRDRGKGSRDSLRVSACLCVLPMAFRPVCVSACVCVCVCAHVCFLLGFINALKTCVIKMAPVAAEQW